MTAKRKPAKKSASRLESKRTGISYEAVRAFALSLPGIEEGTSYGTSAFRVRKKLLTRVQPDFDDTLVLSIDSEQREALMSAYPKVFFVTEHYVGYPYVLVRLSHVSSELFQELFEAAWRRFASKAQVSALEARS